MIRKYNQTDRQNILSIMQQFYDSPAVLHSVDGGNFVATLNEVESNGPFVELLVCQIDTTIAGYCLLTFSYSNEVGGLQVWIEEICVVPDYRGRGIGSAFVNYCLTTFEFAKRFRLEVESNNIGAIKLYDKLGFQQLNYMQMYLDK